VSSPDSAVVYDLVNTNKTEVTKEKIEDATASAPKDWDCTQSLELYMFSLVKNSGGIEVYAVKTGTELQIFGDESYSLPSSKLPSHSGKPFKASYSLTKAIKAAPKKISMIDRFGKSFDLPEGSMVYAMWFRIDYSKLNDISYLREHGNNDGEFGGYTVTRITTTDNSVIDIDDIGQSELSLKSNYNDVITLNVDGTFEWESPDFEVNPFYFTPPFHKTGKFTKLGDEYGALKLTATDGSVAFIYKKSSNGPEWYIAIYPVVEQSVTFFNRVAAEKIISW
jgi:hypothetical protein